ARAAGTVHDDGRVLVEVLGDVGDPQRQLASGHATAAGDAEAAELLGRARVENDQLLALLDARRQLLRLDLGDVVDHLDLLPEILARYVHSPLGGETVGDPSIDPALEEGHPAVAHALDGGGREPGPSPVVVAHHAVLEAVALGVLGGVLLHALADRVARRHVEAGHLTLVADQPGDLPVDRVGDVDDDVGLVHAPVPDLAHFVRLEPVPRDLLGE